MNTTQEYPLSELTQVSPVDAIINIDTKTKILGILKERADEVMSLIRNKALPELIKNEILDDPIAKLGTISQIAIKLGETNPVVFIEKLLKGDNNYISTIAEKISSWDISTDDADAILQFMSGDNINIIARTKEAKEEKNFINN